jgi:hypothetical protein
MGVLHPQGSTGWCNVGQGWVWVCRVQALAQAHCWGSSFGPEAHATGASGAVWLCVGCSPVAAALGMFGRSAAWLQVQLHNRSAHLYGTGSKQPRLSSGVELRQPANQPAAGVC